MEKALSYFLKSQSNLASQRGNVEKEIGTRICTHLAQGILLTLPPPC